MDPTQYLLNISTKIFFRLCLVMHSVTCMRPRAPIKQPMSYDRISNEWRLKGFTFGASGSGLTLWGHTDKGYRQRTTLNAECGTTAAIAADYSTGGERLTKQMAGARYIPLPLFLEPDEAGRRLAEFMALRRAESLNIAGNGIHTLHGKGWTQDAVDLWLFECLSIALKLYPIAWIQSGGQTGLDFSGAICAARLEVPAHILFPAGFIQRDVKGVDKPQDPVALLALIQTRALMLPSLFRTSTQESSSLAQQDSQIRDHNNPHP